MMLLTRSRSLIYHSTCSTSSVVKMKKIIEEELQYMKESGMKIKC